MNIKDIMIRDWVMKPYPNDRESLREDQIELDDFYLEEEWETISDCKPIPLTKEILEKNFEPDGSIIFCDREYLEYKITDTLIGQLSDKGEFIITYESEYPFLTINYVHQLQHFLRLMGYDKEIVI